MAPRKRTTLPKDFGTLLDSGELAPLVAVFVRCDVDARTGYSKATALADPRCTDEFSRWLVEHGADVDARDMYQRTPLMERASSWRGGLEILLELGASLEATDYQGRTALHVAAQNERDEAVRLLLQRGATVDAADDRGHTPLEFALVSCTNASVNQTAGVAEALITSGAAATAAHRAQIARIGESFEFSRASFNPGMLAEADAGLRRLYALFDVPPVPALQRHDGVTRITVQSTTWKKQHSELWNLLVPPAGAAATVQGEVIRASGRIADEMHRNGGMNWNRGFVKMINDLGRHLRSGSRLNEAALGVVDDVARLGRKGTGDWDQPTELMRLAVEWVLANPDPVALPAPSYAR